MLTTHTTALPHSYPLAPNGKTAAQTRRQRQERPDEDTAKETEQSSTQLASEPPSYNSAADCNFTPTNLYNLQIYNHNLPRLRTRAQPTLHQSALPPRQTLTAVAPPSRPSASQEDLFLQSFHLQATSSNFIKQEPSNRNQEQLKPTTKHNITQANRQLPVALAAAKG